MACTVATMSEAKDSSDTAGNMPIKISRTDRAKAADPDDLARLVAGPALDITSGAAALWAIASLNDLSPSCRK